MRRTHKLFVCTLSLAAVFVMMSRDAEATIAESRCGELGGKVVTIRGADGTVVYRGCCFEKDCTDITNLPRKLLKRR